MSKLYLGSLCLTDIIAKAKEGHPAFTKGKNGKVYFNVVIWANDGTDEYGNHMSLKIGKKEDGNESYIGNAKLHTPPAIKASDIDDEWDKVVATAVPAGKAADTDDDLPF